VVGEGRGKGGEGRGGEGKGGGTSYAALNPDDIVLIARRGAHDPKEEGGRDWNFQWTGHLVGN